VHPIKPNEVTRKMRGGRNIERKKRSYKTERRERERLWE